MEVLDDNQRLGPVVNVTTDREARLKFWYVAQVRSCCEKKVASKINALGIETFVPTQTEIRQWSDRKKKIEKLLIPLMVFFRADESLAKEVERMSYVFGLLKSPGQKEAAVIPNDQIDRLKFMLGNCDSEITIEPLSIKKGDFVKIARGKLKGLEGYVSKDASGRAKVSIVIDFLGCASVEIPITDIIINA